MENNICALPTWTFMGINFVCSKTVQWRINSDLKPQLDSDLGSESSPLCVKLGKLYVVKHNRVTWGVFNDYMMNNYMFRPVLVIFRLSQGNLRTTKSIHAHMV